MKSQGDLLTSEISPAVKPEPSSPGTQMAPVSPDCEHEKWIHQRVCSDCGIIEEYTAEGMQ